MTSTTGSDSLVRGIDDVLITAEMARRPSRSPDYEAESRALGRLAEEMATNPCGVLQRCAEWVLELCHADSAGVSILEPGGTTGMLRWHAAAGAFAPERHGTMPREGSPCGTVMERNCVLLFREAERFFPALRGLEPLIHENLVAPWHVKGKAVGTLWAIKHTAAGRFDAEDARILQSLARFAAAAFQMTSALEEATAERVELEQRSKAAQDIEARLQAAIDLVGLSPYSWNPVTGALDWDARLKAMWGLPPDAHVDETVFMSGIHPEDRPRVEAAIAQCSDPAGSGLYVIEYRVIGIGDGIERWVSTQGRTTFENGQPVGFTGAVLDITTRKRAEEALHESGERLKVLVAELQHRTRNLLGVVRSIADRTLASSPSLEAFRERFRNRIDALSRVNGLLSRLDENARISFDALIRAELAVHGVLDGDGQRAQVTLDGPAGIRLRSATVQTLALGLHELATNAIKYGALSGPEGRLLVRWCLMGGEGAQRRLWVNWQESGVSVPATVGGQPPRRGSGRELIERSLPYQLGAETSYELTPEGVRCTIILPVPTGERGAEHA